MKINWQKTFGHYKLQRGLAIAIAMGLMTGLYLPHAQATTYNGKVGISGNLSKDQKFLGKDIVSTDDKGNIVYTFNGDTIFNMENKVKAHGIALGTNKNVIINNNSGDLYLNSSATISGSNGTAGGISLTDGDNVTINSNVKIQAHSNSCFANGIGLNIEGSGEGKKTDLTINGDVVMRGADVENPWGVTAENMYGGMGPGGWVNSGDMYAPDYTGARWAPSGMSVGTGHGSTLTVNGNVDLAIKGSALVMSNYYDGDGTINLNGGNIRIETPQSVENTYYSIANYGGVVNINNTGKYDVNIKGNMIIMNNADGRGNPFFFQDGTVNLTLANKNSIWTGVVDNTSKVQSGVLNLTLQDGALWKHLSTSKTNGLQAENMPKPSNEKYGKYDGISYVTTLKGGSTANKAGAILQADKAAINIDNYSGHTVIMYEHTNNGSNVSDYAAGDVVINSAATGSSVVLSTDSKNIDMKDYKVVDKVLNTLAGKLTYQGYVAGEKNLSGKVQIAEGLTSSSASLATGDLTFNSSTGKGQYHSDRVINDFATTITGDAAKDQEYQEAGVIADNAYIFKGNTSIDIKDGTAAIDASKELNIQAKDNVLVLNVTSAKEGTALVGVNYSGNGNLSIDARSLKVKVENANANVKGIASLNKDSSKKSLVKINGDVDVNLLGQDYTVGVYAAGNTEVNITGNVTMKGENGAWGIDNKGTSSFGYHSISGIYAGSVYNPQIGSTININGNVDLAVNGTGVIANGNNSTVNINGGGVILTNKENEDVHYSLAAENGIINVNMDRTATGLSVAGGKELKLYGNIGLLTGAVNDADPAKNTTVNVGLSTKNSVFHGVIFDQFGEKETAKGYQSEANLFVNNGATWINEQYGITDASFNGSEVERFIGGTSAKTAGAIFQKDTNALTINNFSGNAVIMYEHDGEGTKVEDYKAGDIVVKSAAKDSSIILSTDSKNIAMNDDAKVESVLGALAGKLQYLNSDKDKNLSGKVQIAEGLTSSSASKVVGDLQFGADHRGEYVAGSASPVDPVGPEQPGGEDIQWGNYENSIMHGVRSAMMDAMLAWRDNAGHGFERTKALRAGEDEGAWVKAYGGKLKYEGSTDFDNSYWAVQFGYDRKLANGWNVGAAVDYREGDGSYMLGGEGDTKLYDFGVYGTRTFADNSYVDITVKSGRSQNDYTVYNGSGIAVAGDYASRGYAVSAQYGKRVEAGDSYFEPQLQLTWAHLDAINYNAISATHGALNVNQDAFDSLVGRIGIEAGKETVNGSIYARLSLNHEFSGDIDGQYYAIDGGLKATSYDVSDTWSDLTLGANYNLSEDSSLYADITKTLTGDYKQAWKVSAGLNVTF